MKTKPISRFLPVILAACVAPAGAVPRAKALRLTPQSLPSAFLKGAPILPLPAIALAASKPLTIVPIHNLAPKAIEGVSRMAQSLTPLSKETPEGPGKDVANGRAAFDRAKSMPADDEDSAVSAQPPREEVGKDFNELDEDRLIQLLRAPHYGDRKWAASVLLIRVSAPGAPGVLPIKNLQAVINAFVGALQDEDKEVRVTATLGLGEYPNEKAIAALIQALRNDSYHFVRLYAAEALGQLNAVEGTDALLHALSHDLDKHTRFKSVGALGKIGALAPMGIKKKILSALKRQGLNDPDKDVREQSKYVIRHLQKMPDAFTP